MIRAYVLVEVRGESAEEALAGLRAIRRAVHDAGRTVNERDVPIPPDHPITDDAAALLARACRPLTGEPA